MDRSPGSTDQKVARGPEREELHATFGFSATSVALVACRRPDDYRSVSGSASQSEGARKVRKVREVRKGGLDDRRPRTDHKQTTKWRSLMVTGGHRRSVRTGCWSGETLESRGSRRRVACLHTVEATGSKPVSPTTRDPCSAGVPARQGACPVVWTDGGDHRWTTNGCSRDGLRRGGALPTAEVLESSAGDVGGRVAPGMEVEPLGASSHGGHCWCHRAGLSRSAGRKRAGGSHERLPPWNLISARTRSVDRPEP